MEATARDSAVLISLLLQNQVALADIAHSLTINPDGAPPSIVGAVVRAMLDLEGEMNRARPVRGIGATTA